MSTLVPVAKDVSGPKKGLLLVNLGTPDAPESGPVRASETRALS